MIDRASVKMLLGFLAIIILGIVGILAVNFYDLDGRGGSIEATAGDSQSSR